MTDASDGRRAAAILAQCARWPAHVQLRPSKDDYATTWRAAARHAPAEAVRWWAGDDPMGGILRQKIPLAEAGLLVSLLPAREVVEQLRDYDACRLTRLLLRFLPNDSVQRTWEYLLTEDALDAMETWESDSELGRILRKFINPAAAAGAWERLLDSSSMEDALWHWSSDDRIGRAVRRHASPDVFLDAWRKVGSENAYWGMKLMDHAPARIVKLMAAEDLEPYAASDCETERRFAARHLQAIRRRCGFATHAGDPGVAE
jgi:hypothetical protein